jgi:hypothetical protein
VIRHWPLFPEISVIYDLGNFIVAYQLPQRYGSDLSLIQGSKKCQLRQKTWFNCGKREGGLLLAA